jgi:aspartate/glutamate racemase
MAERSPIPWLHIAEAVAEEAKRLKDRGCEAAVLGCTEIPLIVDPEGNPMPTRSVFLSEQPTSEPAMIIRCSQTVYLNKKMKSITFSRHG